MKKLLKSLMLVAVAAMGLTACQNDIMDEGGIQKNDTFTLTISAEKPALDATRTEHTNGTVIWSANDQVRACYKHTNGTWSRYYLSDKEESVITEDGTTALFSGFNTSNGGFPAQSGGSYTFYAGYPRTAIGGDQTNAPTNGELSVVVPSEQSMPKAGTFDANGDILIGVSEPIEDPNAAPVDLVFTRMVSHGCVTLKKLAAENGEIVESVTFTAPEGINLSGEGTVNFEMQTMTDLDKNYVVVYMPKSIEATNEMTIWFCCAPAVIEAGKTFTIKVETTRGTYTRAITANEKGIQFRQNTYSTLSVNMSSAEFTPTEIIEEGTEVTATISFSSAAHRVSQNGNGQVWAKDGVTFTNNKAASTNAVVDNTNPVRLYASSEVIVEADNGMISNIEFDCNSSSYATAMKNSIGTVSGATVTISNDKVTVALNPAVKTFKVAKLTAQVRLDALTVIYTTGSGDSGETPTEPEPTPDPEEPEEPEEPETPGEGGEEVTVTFNTSASNTNPFKLNGSGTAATLDASIDGVSIKITKESSSSNCALYSPLRFYKDHKMTFTSDKKITKIVFSYDTGKTPEKLTIATGSGSFSDLTNNVGTYTCSGETNIAFTAPAQVRFNSIEVTYAE